MGYVTGNQVNVGWITGDGQEWGPITPTMQMAMVPISSLDKTGDVIVLAIPQQGRSEAVLSSNDQIADRQALMQATPNPFNPTTEVWFNNPANGGVTVSVFDVKGHLVRKLLNQELHAGEHRVIWNGRSDSGEALASGIYLVHMRTNTSYETIRVTLLQ